MSSPTLLEILKARVKWAEGFQLREIKMPVDELRRLVEALEEKEDK